MSYDIVCLLVCCTFLFLVFLCRYNQIAGDALVQCAVKMASALEGRGLQRPLNRLVLTGNKVLQRHRARLNVFYKVAHQLEANMIEETSVPLADHVAQM